MENKLTWWFVYEWGKPIWEKPYRVILKSPLPRIHYYQNKWLQVKESQYLILTYSWTLTLKPNWPCSVVTIFPFQCTAPSTWLANCADPSTLLQSPTREGCWLQSSSVHHTMKIKKLIGYKTLRCTKQQLLHKKDELRQILSLVTICLNKLCLTLVQLLSPLMALKIIILCV